MMSNESLLEHYDELIHTLILPTIFDSKIEIFSDSVTHLMPSDVFNKNIDNLPSSHLCDLVANCVPPPNNLTHLTTCCKFNQSIIKVMSKELIVDDCFCESIEKLNNFQTHLFFNNYFNKNKVPELHLEKLVSLLPYVLY